MGVVPHSSSRANLAFRSKRHDRRERYRSGFNTEDARAERDLLPACLNRGSDFAIREAAFGTDGECCGKWFAEVDFSKWYAAGVGEEASYSGWGLADPRLQTSSGFSPCIPLSWFGDVHEPIPAALLCRFDDSTGQSSDSTAVWLSYAALRDERHQRGDAELGELFDEPFLPIAFGNRDANRQMKR